MFENQILCRKVLKLKKKSSITISKGPQWMINKFFIIQYKVIQLEL